MGGESRHRIDHSRLAVSKGELLLRDRMSCVDMRCLCQDFHTLHSIGAVQVTPRLWDRVCDWDELDERWRV